MSIPQDPAKQEELARAKLATHVKRVVADWPELTSEQLDNVSALLRRATKPTT
jgi:hypothetical protein